MNASAAIARKFARPTRSFLSSARRNTYNLAMARPFFAACYVVSLSLLSGCFDTPPLDPMAQGEELVVVTRNTPTTYYFQGDRPSGFDYALIKAFAREQGMRLRIKVAFSLHEVFETLDQGEAHVAAAGLSQSTVRDTRFLASKPYLQQQPLVVYKSGSLRPRTLDDLVGRDLVIVAGSVHLDTLIALETRYSQAFVAGDSRRRFNGVNAVGHRAKKRIWRLSIRLSSASNSSSFPEIVAALEIGEAAPVVWYLPQSASAQASLDMVNAFLTSAASVRTDCPVESVNISAAGSTHRGSAQSPSNVKYGKTFLKWQPLMETIAGEYQMDWRLLAAMAYQESHWDPTPDPIPGFEA